MNTSLGAVASDKSPIQAIKRKCVLGGNQTIWDQTRAMIGICIWALAFSLMGGCEEATKSERWIGTYLYPNHTMEFPLYMEITITGGRVSGRAFDSTMDEATISGSVEGAAYSLLLHPLKHGASKEQDVHFRGTRSNGSITGEWEHVVGVKGKWTASKTDLAPMEALNLYALPCDEAKRNTKEASCAK